LLQIAVVRYESKTQKIDPLKKGNLMSIIQKQNPLFFSLIISSVLLATSLKPMTDPVPEATLFDYSVAIAGFINQINSMQDQLNSINGQITLLQTTTAYSAVTAPALTTLTNQQTQLTSSITDMQTVLTEITAITNLDSATQDQLYYFYTVVGASYQEFMVRMPFNYQAALIDPIIVTLLADTTNTVDTKTAIAQLVYQNYPINGDLIRSLVQLYRYLP
jgi:hypothetical protein